ncbi:MAG: radical SAM family heme chaperone HemW [Dysgonamonadaceae bacterium]|jgi:oxygen-independent coproporphyrinogen-3 oxidase|nr:radical SAM family heme chaperone HemW [Dysgonamonadaceae bacterium]
MAGIYIHIPFCKKRCLYCDFFSSTDTKEKIVYVAALCRELADRKDYLQAQAIETVYFGGGTPSLLQADNFEKIFDTLRCYYGLDSPTIEVTLEANPDDINTEYLQSIEHLPFNRISLGIQSFDEKELQFLNRRHDASSAVSAVRLLQKAGFDNISIDLMYGLPGQKTETWAANLRQAIELNIQHISAYHLIYEEGSPLYSLLEQGLTTPVDEETSVQLFEMLIDTLQDAGFEQYEIANFAKPGYHSRHNTAYWTGAHYLGVGASAHSYNGISRQWNKRLTGAEYLSQGIEQEIIDTKTAYNDFVITRLRMMEGIDLRELLVVFGAKQKTYCLKQAQKYLDGKLLEISNEQLKLTRKGIFVSDGIMRELLA